MESNSQWNNGFNSVIGWMYIYIAFALRDPAMMKRLSYHNDYDQVSFFYAPPDGTNVELVCCLNLDKMVDHYGDMIRDVEWNITNQNGFIQWKNRFISIE